MWATSVPVLVFLGLSVLDLGPMYATDRQSDVRQHHRLMPPPIRGIITTGWIGMYYCTCVRVHNKPACVVRRDCVRLSCHNVAGDCECVLMAWIMPRLLSVCLCVCERDIGWRFGVAVTRWSRSTQLLYIEPG